MSRRCTSWLVAPRKFRYAEGVSWEPVENALRQSHAATSREGGGLEIRRADALVVVRPVEVEGRPWVKVSIEIATRAEVNLTTAMMHNFESPIGALEVAGDRVLLAQTLPLDGLDQRNLDEVIEFLSGKIAELRAALVVARTAAADDYASSF